MNDFDAIAPIYDKLAQLVFLGSIHKSQTIFLDKMEPEQTLIILGGGSGKILEKLDQLSTPLKVDFVEPSGNMIEKAQKRILDSSNLNITFHQKRFEEFVCQETYDWVHCGFFLDLFKKESLKEVLVSVKTMMNTNSKLLVCDFRIDQNNYWQTSLTKVMHLFFKTFAKLESDKLQNIEEQLKQSGFKMEEQQLFFKRFIFSGMYGVENS